VKLWLLERPDSEVGYDENVGFVVRAETEKAARAFVAKIKSGDEHCDVWLRSGYSDCTEIPIDGPEALILNSFNAG
jgi:hypothetical protein